MRIRPIRFVLSSWAALSLLACTEPPQAPRPAAEGHVILVIVDTLRADHLPIYGYPRPTAPHLQALATRGWVFDRALAQSGWTLPATGSILSGQLPTEHGAVRDGVDVARFGKFEPSTQTAAEAFAAAGFRTAAVVNNVFFAPEFGFNRGFETYDYQGPTPLEHRSAVETVDAGLAWLDASPTPGFLMLHFMEPHTSYAAGAPERGMFAGDAKDLPVPFPFSLEEGKLSRYARDSVAREAVVGLYDEEIHATDRGLGRLVQGLSERGLIDKTWVIVTSDHGEELWDHGGFEHGHHLMGELVRVPLVVAGPGTTHRRVAEPVAQLDIHATLVGLSGRRAEPTAHGVDLVWALGEPGRLTADRPIVAEGGLYGPWRSSVTVGQYRLVTNHESGFSILFEVDAQGQNDRAVREPDKEISDQLLSTMQRLRKGRGAPQIAQSADSVELDSAKLEQLRALGYVE